MIPTISKSKLALLLAAWACLALSIAWSGAIHLLPFPPIIIGTLVLAAFAWLRLRPGWWKLAMSLKPSTYIAVHLTRFVGIYFLLLHAQGRLPYDFAVLGGWGDIATASGATVLLLTRSKNRALLLTWNTLGLIDILFVITTAARLMLSDPASMNELLHLPLALLPLFIVPLILISHLLLFIHLSRSGRKHKAAITGNRPELRG